VHISPCAANWATIQTPRFIKTVRGSGYLFNARRRRVRMYVRFSWFSKILLWFLLSFV
jgi:hypothetical protein